jgi:hypothetical protein
MSYFQKATPSLIRGSLHALFSSNPRPPPPLLGTSKHEKLHPELHNSWYLHVLHAHKMLTLAENKQMLFRLQFRNRHPNQLRVLNQGDIGTSAALLESSSNRIANSGLWKNTRIGTYDSNFHTMQPLNIC